jgi:hypothetical protein
LGRLGITIFLGEPNGCISLFLKFFLSCLAKIYSLFVKSADKSADIVPGKNGLYETKKAL